MTESGDYISREETLKRLCADVCNITDFQCDEIRCAEWFVIHDAPAADVRPVVLCRDCKWCHAGYCEKYDDLIPFGCANKPWEDWFCADGKKREES